MAGAGIFDVSETGHLVYAPGRERATDRVVWVDRSGNATPVDPEWGGPFYSPRLSPNGDRLAVIVANAGGMTVHLKLRASGVVIRARLNCGRDRFLDHRISQPRSLLC